MPSAVESAPADGINDPFNYDVDEEDVFRPFDTSLEAPATTKPTSTQGKADLGLDEEIKTIKKRVPIPKLDENRLVHWKQQPGLRLLLVQATFTKWHPKATEDHQVQIEAEGKRARGALKNGDPEVVLLICVVLRRVPHVGFVSALAGRSVPSRQVCRWPCHDREARPFPTHADYEERMD